MHVCGLAGTNLVAAGREPCRKEMPRNLTRNNSPKRGALQTIELPFEKRTLVFSENTDDAALNLEVIRSYHDGCHL
jgi:hypothetical protein